MLSEHLEKLKYFYEIAKSGSFRKASISLHITQPSLTKSIKVLEESIQKKLFVRTPKGVNLTNQGEVLYNYCIDLFYKLEEVEGLLESNNDPMNTTVRIGTYDSIAIYFWPQFIKYLVKKYPQLKIQLSTNRSHIILEELEKGLHDICLSIEPTNYKHIETKVISKDHFNFYVAPRSTEKVFKNINDAPIIYMPQTLSNFDKYILDKLNEIKSKNKSYETSSLESAKALAENGVGMAILPSYVANDAVKNKKLVPVKSKSTPTLKSFKHNIGVSYSSYNKDSILINTLVKEIINYSSKILQNT